MRAYRVCMGVEMSSIPALGQPVMARHMVMVRVEGIPALPTVTKSALVPTPRGVVIARAGLKVHPMRGSLGCSRFPASLP